MSIPKIYFYQCRADCTPIEESAIAIQQLEVLPLNCTVALRSIPCTYVTSTRADMTKHLWDCHLRTTRARKTQFSRIKAPLSTQQREALQLAVLRFAHCLCLIHSAQQWSLYDVTARQPLPLMEYVCAPAPINLL